MISVDGLLDRTKTDGQYECVQFLCEAWEYLFQADITNALKGFLLPPDERTSHRGVKHRFELLKVPHSPCICVCRRLQRRPHVGLFLRGRILHMDGLSAKYVPIDVVKTRYPRMRFYKVLPA